MPVEPAEVSIGQLLQDAVAAYSAGRLADADERCRDVLRRRPDDVAALQLMAAIAGQSGSPRRGIGILQRMLALQPKHAEGHIQLAKLLRQDGRTADAISALNTAIELQPESAAAQNDLGLIHLAEGNPGQAGKCFSRAIELNPAMAIAHYNQGLSLERRGLYADAMAAYRQALKIDPHFAEARAKLANLLFSYGDESEALDALREVVAARPDSPVGLLSQAKLCLEQGRPADAEAPLRRAVELDPQNSDAHSLLATALLELGRFADAAAAADLSLALNGSQIAAWHHLAQAKKLTEADRPLIARIEWILKESGLADDARARLHLALGKAYDDLREYENAIRHFDEGNRLHFRRDAPYVAANHAATVDRIIATFTAEFFSRNANLASDSELPVFILGMPRSGTTLVEQIVSSHPQIAAGDELAFWGERARNFAMDSSSRINPDWAASTAREYEAVLRTISPVAQRVTDKRPQNFTVIPLVHAIFPRARIIHCTRHPVDTCLSIYFQNFARKMDFAYDRSDLADFYRQYQRLMAHWRKLLPAPHFLEVPYEELVADRETWTRRMIGFCGLEWDDACLHSERNMRAVRTASVWQARQPVYQTSVARWRNYKSWLGPLRELLPDADRADAMMR